MSNAWVCVERFPAAAHGRAAFLRQRGNVGPKGISPQGPAGATPPSIAATATALALRSGGPITVPGNPPVTALDRRTLTGSVGSAPLPR
jgi:hypothetical protein